MDLYNSYKNSRNASWQVLIDYNITSLPVSVSKIAKLSNIKIVKNSDMDTLGGNEIGMSIFVNDIWHIVYDDDVVPGRKRFTIAHELGHIFLGHPLTNGVHARKFYITRPEIEIEADIFAARLLAPACILHELGISDAEEIIELCGLSKTAAKRRSERIKILEARNAWYKHPLEIRVREQFKDFIEGNKPRKGL